MGNIVWLASYPKSGNTWIRAFLANLVANRSEPVALTDLPKYCEDEARPDLFGMIAGKPSTELSLDEIIALRPQVHALIAANARGSRFVKTHNFAGAMGGQPLHNASVTAGAIYVVRNPLDVAISMTHHFGITLDEAVLLLHRRKTLERGVPDGAFDARAILPDADEARDLREMLAGFLDEIFVAEHQHALAGKIGPAARVHRP